MSRKIFGKNRVKPNKIYILLQVYAVKPHKNKGFHTLS